MMMMMMLQSQYRYQKSLVFEVVVPVGGWVVVLQQYDVAVVL